MVNSQRDGKNYLAAFDKQDVPQTLQNIKVKIVAEKTCEPLQRHHRRVQANLFKVQVKFRQSLFDQRSDDELVYARTHHQLVVIERQIRICFQYLN